MRLTRAIAPLHRAFRRQKLRLVFSALQPDPSDTMLDVGGGIGITEEWAPLYRHFRRVSIVNLDPDVIDSELKLTVDVTVADACQLPLASNSYDWVFCNAVIEHVGPWKRQAMLATEIRRVARKGYFVATPNRNFPVDPHTMLPFYQFLPQMMQRIVAPFSPGYLQKFEPVYMLTAGDMQSLFPEATIVKLGIMPVPHNIVAYWVVASPTPVDTI